MTNNRKRRRPPSSLPLSCSAEITTASAGSVPRRRSKRTIRSSRLWRASAVLVSFSVGFRITGSGVWWDRTTATATAAFTYSTATSCSSNRPKGWAATCTPSTARTLLWATVPEIEQEIEATVIGGELDGPFARDHDDDEQIPFYAQHSTNGKQKNEAFNTERSLSVLIRNNNNNKENGNFIVANGRVKKGIPADTTANKPSPWMEVVARDLVHPYYLATKNDDAPTNNGSPASSQTTPAVVSRGRAYFARKKVANVWRRVVGRVKQTYQNRRSASTQVEASAVSHATTETEGRKQPTTFLQRRRREKKRQLSSLLKRVNKLSNTQTYGVGMTVRVLTGLISALAEEVEGLEVDMQAREETPLWRKHIDRVRISFTRLGFKPLYMGGPDQLLQDTTATTSSLITVSPTAGDVRRIMPARAPSISSLSIITTDDTNYAESLGDDECPVDVELDAQGFPMVELSCADTAFQQMDVDNSGALDKDEIADALVLAARASEQKVAASGDEGGFGGAMSAAAADLGAQSQRVIRGLAKQLVDLYDANDDGVIDREEYQSMVEDMAALRQLQKEREFKERHRQERKNEEREAFSPQTWIWNSISNVMGRNKTKDDNSTIILDKSVNPNVANEIVDASEYFPETLGKIEVEGLKLDLRQVVFGAIPLIKHITPGGPLILEPCTVTVTGSFSSEDIMKSSLVSAGLRQLVSFVLRRRVRSFRDLMEFAVFYGRKWKRDSAQAPKVDCTELTSVEFDDQDRLVITGRANVRASIDAPLIDNSFKLRAKVASRHGGHAIKLAEPEIAIVIECPSQLEASLNNSCERLGLPKPPKPRPIYSYIPIYSPFRKDDDDTGGYYMGEDNILKSIYVKDNCLRFEMSSVLRPGKFLGSHYLAFTVPEKSLIITVDRVKNGMRAARRRKKALAALKKARAEEATRKANQAEDALAMDDIDVVDKALEEEIAQLEREEEDSKPPGKGFFSRFVDGYLQAASSATDDNKERLAVAISDWFGRQGIAQAMSSSRGVDDDAQ